MTGVRDTLTLAMRMLKHNIRTADTIMTTLVMPVMILLAFVFVIGGAMDTGTVAYVDYVVPVVLLYTVLTGISYTAWRVNQDVTSGFQDRLRSLPIARWSIIGGHVVASVLVNAVSVVIVFGVALLIGYRPRADAAGWLVSIVLIVVCLVAFTVMGVSFGMTAKTSEGAGMFVYFGMGLLFVSSGFAPTQSMPAPLRAFADHQPMTPIINAFRDAQLGATDPVQTWIALACLAAIIVVFAALAAIVVRRRHV